MDHNNSVLVAQESNVIIKFLKEGANSQVEHLEEDDNVSIEMHPNERNSSIVAAEVKTFTLDSALEQIGGFGRF